MTVVFISKILYFSCDIQKSFNMFKQLIILANKQINAATHLNELQQIKVEFLGKKSPINQAMQQLGSLTEQERKNLGQQVNTAKQQISELIQEKLIILTNRLIEQRLIEEALDLTIPPRLRKYGSIHPISQALEELIQIFAKFGFTTKYGPSIETDWYNFTALNIDPYHPARQMHDTFYLHNGEVLRTHTSPIQIRTMQADKAPLRVIAPGRTYRSDSDLTHTPMFHQIEGLMIDKNINMGQLKYVIIDFIKHFFEQTDIKIRFRPSFFPFTEPSAEVDICLNNDDKWLEVLGCGMVHPKVLQNVNINPDEYQGFAFGLGVERFAMLKYNIKDLRQFFDGDIRFLNHYNFSAFDVPNLVTGLTK